MYLFLGFSTMELRTTSPIVINSLFLKFIESNFLNFIVDYTDGSVSPLSTGYYFYISSDDIYNL